MKKTGTKPFEFCRVLTNHIVWSVLGAAFNIGFINLYIRFVQLLLMCFLIFVSFACFLVCGVVLVSCPRVVRSLVPTWPQLGPSWPQVGPKLAPSWPKLAPDWPKVAPRWAQDGPRWPQDGPRWPQDGPKWPKMVPRSPQNCSKHEHKREKAEKRKYDEKPMKNQWFWLPCRIPNRGKIGKLG